MNSRLLAAWSGLIALIAFLAGGVTFDASAPAQAHPAQAHAPILHSTETITHHVYVPLVAGPLLDACTPIPDASYATLPIISPPTDRPAEEHPDVNLSIRGYQVTDAYTGLIPYTGPIDDLAPQLSSGLCASRCGPPFANVYQVYDWDWEHDARGSLIVDPEVTLVGIPVTPGETIHVPDSGYDIGQGYEVMVLYASTERITLKYTREDNVVWGYTLHVEGVCAEPGLLALYESANAAGRTRLPVLQSGQAFGRARGTEIRVAIRDTGTFMEPRRHEDWWRSWLSKGDRM